MTAASWPHCPVGLVLVYTQVLVYICNALLCPNGTKYFLYPVLLCSCTCCRGSKEKEKLFSFFFFFPLLSSSLPLNLSWPSASYMRKTTACLLPANLGKEQRGSRSQVKTTDLQVSPYPLKFSFLHYSLSNVSNHLACIMKVRSGTH